MTQIEKLQKKIPGYLRGNKIVDDRKLQGEFTDDELHLIEWFIKNKFSTLPTIIPISKTSHLDFIGWNNPKYMDVLICKNWIPKTRKSKILP